MLNIENMCGDHHAHTYGCHYAHLVDDEDDGVVIALVEFIRMIGIQLCWWR